RLLEPCAGNEAGRRLVHRPGRRARGSGLALTLSLAATGCRAPATAGLAAQPGRPTPALVARYAKVELRLPGTGRPALGTAADPFVDFTGPSGRTARVFGFASGDGWTFRFAPPELGEVRYDAHLAPGAPAIARGTFQVRPGADPGPVRVDPDHPHRL